MRYIIFACLAVIALLSCGQAKEQSKNDKKPAGVIPIVVKDFSKLQFANSRDVVCHMPLKAGVGDTATYKGKLYGFCSEECKAAFEKDTEGYISKMNSYK